MDSYSIDLIVLLVVFVICMTFRLKNYWKKKAETAFFVVGQHGRTKEERIWGYRNSLLAGNLKAEKFFVFADIENFMNEKPMKPFFIDNGLNQKIPCVFVDYYIPSRYSEFISTEQRNFQRLVYSFKDGKETCSRMLKEAIALLNLQDETMVLFMPCSSKEKYNKRFTRLCKALSYVEGLNPQLYSIRFIDSRESKHLARNREELEASTNIVVNSDIIGKKAILIDDVITTGSSLREHIQELNMFGVEVVGAVCLAKTIQFPQSSSSIMRRARKEEPGRFRAKYL